MKTNVYKIAELKGFNLYEREKTKVKGYPAWPKYFINGEKYFKEFRLLSAAKKEFSKLTS